MSLVTIFTLALIVGMTLSGMLYVIIQNVTQSNYPSLNVLNVCRSTGSP